LDALRSVTYCWGALADMQPDVALVLLAASRHTCCAEEALLLVHHRAAG